MQQYFRDCYDDDDEIWYQNSGLDGARAIRNSRIEEIKIVDITDPSDKDDIGENRKYDINKIKVYLIIKRKYISNYSVAIVRATIDDIDLCILIIFKSREFLTYSEVSLFLKTSMLYYHIENPNKYGKLLEIYCSWNQLIDINPFLERNINNKMNIKPAKV